MKVTIVSILLLLLNLFLSSKIKKNSESKVKELTDEELNEAISAQIRKKLSATWVDAPF